MTDASKLTGGYDVNVTLFLTEVFEKENKSRLNWFEQNYEKVFQSRPPEQIPRKGKILYEELVKRRLGDQKANQRYGQKRTMPSLPRPDPNMEVLPTMKPVPQRERVLLTEGSEAYLSARIKTSPDERYYYSPTANWEYGWQVEKLPLQSLGNRIHGRKNIINATILRLNGVHPDLPYYRGTTSHNFDIPFL